MIVVVPAWEVPVEDSEDGVGLGTAFASVNQVQFLEIRDLFSMRREFELDCCLGNQFFAAWDKG
jgi:hypothetical protein